MKEYNHKTQVSINNYQFDKRKPILFCLAKGGRRGQVHPLQNKPCFFTKLHTAPKRLVHNILGTTKIFLEGPLVCKKISVA